MPSGHRSRSRSRPHGDRHGHARKPDQHRRRRSSHKSRGRDDGYDLYDGAPSMKLDPKMPTLKAVPHILQHTAGKKVREQTRLGFWHAVRTPFSNMGRDSRSRQSAFKPTEGVLNKAISSGLAVIAEAGWRTFLHSLNKNPRARKWGVNKMLGNVQVSPDHGGRKHGRSRNRRSRSRR
jgi:hypothetical protein